MLVDLKIDLVFIGGNIEESDDGKIHKSDCVSSSAKKGIYHEILGLEKPDLVIGIIFTFYNEILLDSENFVMFIEGFNAGLPAYLSWIPTLKYLKVFTHSHLYLKFTCLYLVQENDIPSYFTEYCWRGYHITLLRLSILDGITVSQGSTNKFKSFVRIPDRSTKIPQFSNHIIFKLQFLN